MSKFLKTILAGTLSETELEYLYSSYDIIGDIAIIKIPDALLHRKRIICDTILSNVKNLRSVFVQNSSVAGEYRLRALEFVSGDEIYLTYYKEFGCKFLVNVATSYFSPRLSTERLRLSNLVNSNELILNMFAGVGTFSIIMATKRNVEVINIDSNLDAFILSIINARINKVSNSVTSYHGDAKIILNKEEFIDRFDRVLLPLPERAFEFIEVSVNSLKSTGGFLHFFSHIKSDVKADVVPISEEHIHKLFANYSHQITHTQIVRDVAPRIYQTVTDLFVKK